jgi:hypothetical protein
MSELSYELPHVLIVAASYIDAVTLRNSALLSRPEVRMNSLVMNNSVD